MKNGDKHCSYCIYYVAFANCQMYCKALLRRITARRDGIEVIFDEVEEEK